MVDLAAAQAARLLRQLMIFLNDLGLSAAGASGRAGRPARPDADR